jgi:hypothetical protein
MKLREENGGEEISQEKFNKTMGEKVLVGGKTAI